MSTGASNQDEILNADREHRVALGLEPLPVTHRLHMVVGIRPRVAADVVFELDDGTFARVTDLQLAAWGLK